ncbi:response regulator [uncultured Paludibaculum sp.]|uniref:response regulator transcription factor n=1 Tax=uncultured Paludibaculum sp. TaxID=1765020 RepID=UPI002AAB54AE|nr:response regulator [uncultured Paludibaculum sp.]
MNLPVTNIPSRIVVGVDDDYRLRESLASLLESAGFSTLMFASAEDFLSSGALAQAGCLLTDVCMPRMDGLELQRRVRLERPALPVVFMTAHNSSDMRRRAFAGGAIEFLYKPFDAAELLQVIERALTGPSNA